MSTFHAALEIGTTRTILATSEAAPGERIKITCLAEIPSSGVRKSEILDINQARESIRSVIHAAEKKQADLGTSLTIGNAFLVVNGQHIRVENYQPSVAVEGTTVSANDIDEVIHAAENMPIPKDRELLDIVERVYTLDNLSGITAPKGMSGRILKLETLQITADRNRLSDARTAAEGAHLEIAEALFSATCAAEAVLGEHERRNGVLLIDFGGGSTSYAVYADETLAAAGSLGVGGDHITNDIATAFQTTNGQAEELKISEAAATFMPNENESARVQIKGDSPLMETRTISRRALNTVVNARVRELILYIRETLENADMLPFLHEGIVITGGGAALRGLDVLLQREFGIPVRHGIPIYVDGLADLPHPESYASIAGALLYAHRNYEKHSDFFSFFKRLKDLFK